MKAETEKLLEEEKMPWLVPACSNQTLKKGSAMEVLGDLCIAGLVPGYINAPFDAYAYVLGSAQGPSWVFEFCSCSSSYLLEDSKADWKKKCSDDPHAQSCHAMLLAITSKQHSQATAWVDKTKGRHRLRIVALLSGC